MHIGRIQGSTRTLGKRQGFMGLPVRDEIDRDHNGTPVMRTTSAWFPTPEEIEAIVAGAPIHLSVWLYREPYAPNPALLTVGEVPASEDKESSVEASPE